MTPSVSKAQRTATAIALHSPQKLYKRNRSLLGLTDKQLREYAQTKEKGIPKKKKK